METIQADIVIVGAGGGGLRAAIAAAEKNPSLTIALVSKVYPMRSHTCAAEGGCAAVVQDHDSLDYHFADTVSGGDWLCDQDVVDYFVSHATEENLRLEHWGCPWSRKPDGRVNVRAFGGMKIERTWFAADKTGFHILHTLFQTSIKFPQIKRYDEYFCTDLLVKDGRAVGLQAIDIKNGTFTTFQAKAVIIATGGAGRVYRFNTNGGIVTGDGMSLAYRQGVPLRDMEFVQYHPTGLPGTGILMTEGCRGEGGILTNKDGYRYLQDYNLGPETPVGQPKNKYMELGPRDRLSQAFWHEEKKGRVIETSRGTAVNLDLTHLGEQKINERLPFIRELSKAYVGVDPVTAPIPVRPTVHYTMGGIQTDINTETPIKGLFAVGECASVGLHGANRLGSNSLAELGVFGKVAGDHAADLASQADLVDISDLQEQIQGNAARWNALRTAKGTESMADIRKELADTMEDGVGIYRSDDLIQKTCDKLVELKDRYKNIGMKDGSLAFNTEWLYAIELGFLLDVGEAMAHSARARKESRGSHQRLDGFEKRDDDKFLKHTLAYRSEDAAPKLEYQDVVITKSKPAERVYGAASEQKEGDK
ncbi:fumarate reductase (quinol) flavoprotein subunit [Gynuella sunshinyii]|uniref:Fumarate reductase flavoprotein subunit n=1 Tax=Gynuella sunshinyii YC6258 TaxID=1445510 RepID=A0A0C5VPY6_9GAMM|nr:fumarate reductase (quinol) flavoprotein subunit [Gynuella sunshinyii]AJQ96281.1 succinate dehydrogenase/fumarate reductase, flavoprotein subunit [Gynuella sunshinyii YC6258]